MAASSYLQSIKQVLYIYYVRTPIKLRLNTLCQRALPWDLALSEKLIQAVVTFFCHCTFLDTNQINMHLSSIFEADH